MLSLFTRSKNLAEPVSRESPSRLLSVWAQRSASRGKGRVVVDLGRTSSKSLNFYTSCAGLVFFQELADELLSPDPNVRAGAISANVPSRSGVDVDLVACWDLLNYLAPGEIQALASSMASRSNSSTMLHLYMWRTPTMPDEPLRFQILSEDKIQYSFTGLDRPAPRYHMSDMKKLLPGFKRIRSFLLRGGLEEQLYARI